MKNTIGTFLGIHMSCSLAWLTAWPHKVMLLYMSRIEGKENVFTCKNRDLNGNRLSQDRKM